MEEMKDKVDNLRMDAIADLKVKTRRGDTEDVEEMAEEVLNHLTNPKINKNY